MVDKTYRSMMKAVSWRMVGTVDTIIISYFVTGKLTFAVSIGAIELFTKMALYFIHERVWNRIHIGRARPGLDYEI